MAKIQLTQELVKEYFDYKDGVLFWKKKTSKYSNAKIGDPAGCFLVDAQKKKRVKISIGGKVYAASRLVFLFHKGWLPKIVDHEDHDTLNNKINNLRAATEKQNCQNKTSKIGSSSQYLGVYFNKNKGKWKASICNSHNKKHLGYFSCEKEAALAYNKGAVLYHKEFANLNIVKP